jgi:uroporphyrin-III C-methyltransferase/precorrin-2 dehydrogenase/sirohydrochlorin ferrochelatase
VAVAGGRDPGRAIAIRDAVTLLLRTGQLPVRRTRRPSETGSIALVGGGPGDPGLITVRGRHLLAQADVVVVDRLAPQELLRELAPDVEVIAVGKTPYTAGPTQEEINDLLVTRAAAGKRVVRLKGGDPFVFGRGGEEVLAAIAAGVPVEVVPGVTSATAVPAAAGIPVTHRGVAASFAVVTAHPGSPAEWDALARGPDTLIVLMGLRELPAIASQLIEHGRPADTPTAVISSGTTDRQRVVTGTLDTVAAQTAGLEPPALTVVGSVVGRR